MTNFQQQELPNDSVVTQTIQKHSNLNFGVYAKVITEGVVRISDRVSRLDN